MKKMVFLLLFMLSFSGCTHKYSTVTGGDIPAGNPMADIEIGMGMRQVEHILGPPSDSEEHCTGKAFIPLYYGTDSTRKTWLYTGLGKITFSAGGFRSTYLVSGIKHNPEGSPFIGDFDFNKSNNLIDSNEYSVQPYFQGKWKGIFRSTHSSGIEWQAVFTLQKNNFSWVSPTLNCSGDLKLLKSTDDEVMFELITTRDPALSCTKYSILKFNKDDADSMIGAEYHLSGGLAGSAVKIERVIN